MTTRRRVLVVGAGLIGTSVGLALTEVADVFLDDPREEHAEGAVARGAGRHWAGEPVDLAVVCAPPTATAQVTTALLRSGVARTVSQVASVQQHVHVEVETAAASVARYCGSHPLAGRETRGPDAASAGLFADRPWVVCPAPFSGPQAVADVHWLATSCGAVPVEMTAAEHDRAVALTSHLPQVAASAVAARLAGDDRPLDLAGPGLQDTTRIAASDPALWREILALNAAHVAPLLHALGDDLAAAAAALDALAADPDDPESLAAVTDLLRRGNAGRGRLPLKRHEQAAAYVPVAVRVPDEPGQLAAVLTAAAAAGVNVEDVRVEHLPGRPRGILELLVGAADAPTARAGLARAGWDVIGP